MLRKRERIDLHNQVTTVEFPDGISLVDAVRNVRDLWPWHSDADGPEWVECGNGRLMAFVEGSDAPEADAALAAMWGGPESGSWLTTKLPADATIAAGSSAAVTEIVRQLGAYTPWINGVNSSAFTSLINVVPADTPMVSVTLLRDEAYALSLKHLLAAGVPIPDGVTRPDPLIDTDLEMVFIQPGWERTLNGLTWRGRMYETWVTLYDTGTSVWTCYWGGRMVGILDDLTGHPYDWWWGPVDDGDPFGAQGVGTDHNFGAQATGIPLSHTMITRRDLKRGVIDHPWHFMLHAADGTHPQAAAVWPAQRWDGSSVDVLPQGSRLRLPPGHVINPAHPQLTRILEQAAIDYGVVFTDTAEGVTLRMEPGADAYLDAPIDIGEVMTAFPWADLQLLEVGSDAVQTPTPEAGVTTYDDAVDATAAPLYHWKLGEAAAATRVLDRKGNYPTNLLKNGPTLGAPGLLSGNSGDTAASFASSPQNLYDDGTPPARAETAWTLVAWIKVEATGGTQEIVCWDSGYPNQWCGLELNASLEPVVWRHDSSDGYPIAASSALTVGGTYRLTGRWDGSTLSLRVNGVTVASVASATSMYAAATPRLIIGTADGNASRFSGVIDEVAWYATAISDVKDTAEYAAGTTSAPAATAGGMLLRGVG